MSAAPLILTAAGFSANFNYPTTVQLRDNLIKLLHSKDERLEDIKDFLADLLSKKELKDIEEILQIIDEGISNLDFTNGSLIRNMIKNDLFKKLNFNNIHYESIINKLKITNEEIVNIVCSYYIPDEIKHQKEFNIFFHSLIKEVFGNNTQIKIFTLNYDCLIEEFAKMNPERYSVFDGHSDGTAETGFVNNFSTSLRSSNQRTINLYKLHGSMNWYKRKSTSYKKPHFFPPNPFILNPTLYKKNIVQQPFQDLFKQFDEQSKKSDVLIVIGYSFRDKEINTKIVDFLSLTNDKSVINISKMNEKNIHKCLLEFNDYNKKEKRNALSDMSLNKLYCIERHIENDNTDLFKELEDILERLNNK